MLLLTSKLVSKTHTPRALAVSWLVFVVVVVVFCFVFFGELVTIYGSLNLSLKGEMLVNQNSGEQIKETWCRHTARVRINDPYVFRSSKSS